MKALDSRFYVKFMQFEIGLLYVPLLVSQRLVLSETLLA